MQTLTMLLVIAAQSGLAQYGWKLVGTSEHGSQIFVRSQQQSTNNPAWVFIDAAQVFPSPQPYGDGRTYQSKLAHLEVRCRERQFRTLSEAVFEKPEIRDEIGFKFLFTPWESATESNVGRLAVQLVCG